MIEYINSLEGNPRLSPSMDADIILAKKINEIIKYLNNKEENKNKEGSKDV